MPKAIVLLSGGQDSTTALYWAREHGYDPIALSLFYGQRHETELIAAREIAKDVALAHHVYRIPALGEISYEASAMVDASKPLKASGGYQDKHAPGGLPTSFVPGRNALFLVLAGAVAVREGANDIITGVCETDYSGYPDCRREFIDYMEKTLALAMPSGCGPFNIHTPLMYMTKAETVKLARRLPGCWDALAKSITCYEGARPGCGKCPACALRAKGFAEAGEKDPAEEIH